jgi:hypothetical protein
MKDRVPTVGIIFLFAGAVGVQLAKLFSTA